MCVVFCLCLLFKGALVKAADGADEIFGKVFEGGAGGDAVIGVAGGLVVFVAADLAYVFHAVFFLFIIFATARELESEVFDLLAVRVGHR